MFTPCIGIKAVQHRNHRNSVQQKKSIDRKAAEKLIKEDRLSDLNVWYDCIPKRKQKYTSRDCRATTRQITSQLRAANLESAGAKFPLKTMQSIPENSRDATPEV